MDTRRFCKCDECGALGLWDGIFMAEEFAYFCPDCWNIFRKHPEFSSYLMHKNRLLRENNLETVEIE